MAATSSGTATVTLPTDEQILITREFDAPKHLRVLREVGVVDVRSDGRHRLYRLNGRALKPIHDWVQGYEQTWSERFDRLDAVLDELKEKDDEGDDDGE